jgi:hypothetical protein
VGLRSSPAAGLGILALLGFVVARRRARLV